MKTKKEMDVLKEEAKSVNEEMRELTDEELAQVTGGRGPDITTMRFNVVPGDELDSPIMSELFIGELVE